MAPIVLLSDSKSDTVITAAATNIWYIYALVDPRTLAVRYVGKTVRLQSRMREHLRDRGDSRKAEWIRVLCGIGLEPDLLVLEQNTGDWREAERRWIAAYRSAQADLTNGTDGGEGLQGASTATRQKISAAQRARWVGPLRERSLQLARSPERRLAIADGLRGMKKSPEHIANLPQNRSDYDWAPEIREQRRVLLKKYAMPIAHAMPRSPAQLEHLKSLQAANVGRPGWARGRVLSEEERKARSVAQRGRPKTAEHREKIRQGALRRWARTREAAERSES